MPLLSHVCIDLSVYIQVVATTHSTTCYNHIFKLLQTLRESLKACMFLSLGGRGGASTPMIVQVSGEAHILRDFWGVWGAPRLLRTPPCTSKMLLVAIMIHFYFCVLLEKKNRSRLWPEAFWRRRENHGRVCGLPYIPREGQHNTQQLAQNMCFLSAGMIPGVLPHVNLCPIP